MITGGMKFFERSKALYSSGARVAASSGGVSAQSILSENKLSSWESGGNIDADIETLNITLANTTPANRILLIGHNFKDFDISFNTLNKQIRDINNNLLTEENGVFPIVNNSLNTNYFSFPRATIQNIGITINGTITPNVNKVLNQIILTDEIGTFIGFPELTRITFNMNEKNTKTKAGKLFVNKQVRTLADLTLNFKNYTQVDDIGLAFDLFVRETDFLFWASGGYQKFRYNLHGFRLEDIFRVQAIKGFPVGFKSGSYQGLMQSQLRLAEST